MKRNMNKWAADIIASKSKKPFPILSFPCISLMGITVKDIIADADNMAKGMEAVAKRTDSLAAVSLMDLSLEAEAFGSSIKITGGEVPTVTDAIVTDEDKANALIIPKVGDGRTGTALKGIEKAVERITDRPVFAGVIGPFSLAGRLVGVSDAMINCYDEPDMMHTVMEKATDFLINYCKAFENAGANGVIIAEPLTGMLSPMLAEEFSHPYMARIIKAVQSETFAVIYHNCGDNVSLMKNGIYGLGAAGYHFGDAVKLRDMLDGAPQNALVMGNVSPANQFLRGTPESVKEETQSILKDCSAYDNFVISSGCDIPPLSPWENIDAFFDAVKDFYA